MPGQNVKQDYYKTKSGQDSNLIRGLSSSHWKFRTLVNTTILKKTAESIIHTTDRHSGSVSSNLVGQTLWTAPSILQVKQKIIWVFCGLAHERPELRRKLNGAIGRFLPVIPGNWSAIEKTILKRMSWRKKMMTYDNYLLGWVDHERLRKHLGYHICLCVSDKIIAEKGETKK